MLHIFLLILSIIGKIILIILGLLLLIILLLLFNPIKYEGHFEKHEKITAAVHISYLFHIIRINYQYPDPGEFTFKILWFSPFQEKPEKSKEGNATTHSVEKGTMKRPKKEVSPIKENESPSSQSDENENIPSRWERILNFMRSLPDKLHSLECTIQTICDKVKKTFTNLKSMKSLWLQDDIQHFLAISKKHLFHLLRHIRPRKLSGYLHFGFADPSDTGQLMAFLSMSYPFIGDSIQYIPEFDNEIFETKIEAKGHIQLYFILYAILMIYFKGHFQEVKKQVQHNLETWRS